MTCFNAVVDCFYDAIEVCKVYLISKSSLNPAQKNYNHLKNEWVGIHKNGKLTFNGPEATVIISILDKNGKILSDTLWFHDLHRAMIVVDVNAYNSMKSFIRMEENEGESTMISHIVFLNVYGKIGMAWNNILVVVTCIKSRGLLRVMYLTIVSVSSWVIKTSNLILGQVWINSQGEKFLMN